MRSLSNSILKRNSSSLVNELELTRTKLKQKIAKLKERDRKLLEDCGQAQQLKQDDRANIIANEISFIRGEITKLEKEVENLDKILSHKKAQDPISIPA